MEVTTYLDLDPGTYTMIVNSDDGFQVSVGKDARDECDYSIGVGEFNGGRENADTQFQFTISQAGAYSSACSMNKAAEVQLQLVRGPVDRT